MLVDPGSYVYTPSVVWRNRFRSVAMHNTFYIEDVEPVVFNERCLFSLNLAERSCDALPWKVEHTLYSIPASRTISFDKSSRITLEDAWHDVPGNRFTSCWNFTLAPEIKPVLIENMWHFFYKDVCVVTMQSNDLTFAVEDSWYAPGYGQKVSCKRLIAKTDLTTQPVKIIFTRK